MNSIMNKNLSYKIVFGLILISFLIPFKGLMAEESISIVLDEKTIKRGYTIRSSDKNISLALLPNFTKKDAQGISVILNDLGRDESLLPSTKNFISNLYEFEIGTKDFIKPYILDLKYATENESEKAVYLYNPYSKKWSAINTAKINTEEKTFRLKLTFPYVKLAVLEEKPLLGKASWYKCIGGLYAASVDYPKKSFLKVTNLDNNKSVIVKVNDYGPDKKIFPDRVIDLDVVAFKKIDSKSKGVINVKVEKL